MSAPTNISALTAIDLGALPATATQRVDDAGTTYDVWYQHTVTTGNGVLGMFGFGDLSVYKPDTSVYTGPAASPTPYFIQDGGNNACCYFPVTDGETYYFKFQTNSGNPSPANLSVSLIAHTTVTVPTGSIAVNDDQAGFPLALISATDADVNVLRYVTSTNGEGVGVLDDGTFALGDSDAGGMQVFSPDYVAGALVSTSITNVATSNRSTAFYTADNPSGPNFTIIRFLVDGTITATTSPITLHSGGLVAIGVNPAETVLYYYGTSATNTTIYQWDLVNDVELSPLITLTGKSMKDCVVLASGNLVIGNSTSNEIHIISPAGAILSTFAVGSTLDPLDRMTRGLTDASVWIWFKINYTSVGVHQEAFVEYKLADGATLTTITGTLFGAFGTSGEAGCYLGVPVADPQRFGNSDSCPFWITRTVPTPPIPDLVNGPEALEAFEAAGFLKAFDVPRVRTAPHLADEGERLFYSKFQLDIEAGAGTVTGQGVDPVLLLRYSDDGGFTWSAWRQLSVGALGQYRWRCIAWRLGMARDRVFQVRQTDPVKSAWLTAYLDFEGSEAS